MHQGLLQSKRVLPQIPSIGSLVLERLQFWKVLGAAVSWELTKRLLVHLSSSTTISGFGLA